MVTQFERKFSSVNYSLHFSLNTSLNRLFFEWCLNFYLNVSQEISARYCQRCEPLTPSKSDCISIQLIKTFILQYNYKCLSKYLSFAELLQCKNVLRTELIRYAFVSILRTVCKIIYNVGMFILKYCASYGFYFDCIKNI